MYQLAPLLAHEAQFVTIQIVLLSEQRLRKQWCHHLDVKHVWLHYLWNRYDAQEITKVPEGSVTLVFAIA